MVPKPEHPTSGAGGSRNLRATPILAARFFTTVTDATSAHGTRRWYSMDTVFEVTAHHTCSISVPRELSSNHKRGKRNSSYRNPASYVPDFTILHWKIKQSLKIHAKAALPWWCKSSSEHSYGCPVNTASSTVDFQKPLAQHLCTRVLSVCRAPPTANPFYGSACSHRT